MKAKIIENYDIKKGCIMFGIAFQVKQRAQYCKYPIGYQSFATKQAAKYQLSKIQNTLNTLTVEQINFINAQPINKHQYVKL